MIRILKTFSGEHANENSGNLNDFLTALIVEVVTENYRQSLAEEIILQSRGSNQCRDIALRSNERSVSGLFASGLNRVAQLTRPEEAISRLNGRTGKVDFVVWYSNRVVGIELKAGSIRYHNSTPRSDVIQRWGDAVRQSAEAQSQLRARSMVDERFAKPISIALMVVSGTAAKPHFNAFDVEQQEEYRLLFESHLFAFSPKPQYVASYEIPQELAISSRRTRGKVHSTKQVHVPFYGFIARARVRR